MSSAPTAPPEEKAPTKLPSARPTVVQMRMFDDLGVNKFRMTFSGGTPLEVNMPNDAGLIDSVHLGQRVRLTVDCYVTDVAGHVARGKEGNLKDVTKRISCKVDSVEVSSFTILEEPA